MYHNFVYIFVNTHIIALGLIDCLSSYVLFCYIHVCSLSLLSPEEEIKESIDIFGHTQTKKLKVTHEHVRRYNIRYGHRHERYL